jgi:hypothetical protein
MGLENYVPVEARIAQFKKDHNGEGSITTEASLTVNEKQQFVMFKAVVKVRDRVVGIGHALESDLEANKAFEKCETAAVGRALTFAGYASSDETELEAQTTNNATKSKGFGSTKKTNNTGAQNAATSNTGTANTTQSKGLGGLPGMNRNAAPKTQAPAATTNAPLVTNGDAAAELEATETADEHIARQETTTKNSSALANVLAKHGLNRK